METVMTVVMILLLLCAFALVAGAGLLEALSDLWRSDFKKMRLYWWFALGHKWAGRDIEWFEGTADPAAARKHQWNQKFPWTADFWHAASITERLCLIAGTMLGQIALTGLLVWNDAWTIWYVAAPIVWFVVAWGVWGGISMYGYHYWFPVEPKGNIWHFLKNALLFWRDDISHSKS